MLLLGHIHLVLVLLGLTILLGGGRCMARREAKEQVSNLKKMRNLQANAKIVLGLVQVLQLCQGTFRIEVPAPFSELSKVFRFVTLDFVSLVNLHCLVSYNWISLFVARCTMPWVRSWLCHCSSQRGVLAHGLICVRNTEECICIRVFSHDAVVFR